MYSDSLSEKIRWSLPWLMRYPAWRYGEWAIRDKESPHPSHLVFLVANHFEPATDEQGLVQLEKWCHMARVTGNAVRDHDGTPFRHTNFFPAEQYHKPLLDQLAALQAEGLGEVEIHLHHGVDKPDTPESFKRVLVDFRDVLAQEHKCLSRLTEDGMPMY